MDTFLIVIIVLFIILSLAGAGVGIYFLMRKKKTDPSGDDSGDAGGESSNCKGIGPGDPAWWKCPGLHTISPRAYSNPAMPGKVWQSFQGPNADLLILQAPDASTSCENYLFRFGTATTSSGTFDNALLMGTTGNNVVVSSANPSLYDVTNFDQNHYGTENFKWARDENLKTWCMSTMPRQCITTNGDASGKLYVMQIPDNFANLPPTDPVKQSFQWIGQPWQDIQCSK